MDDDRFALGKTLDDLRDETVPATDLDGPHPRPFVLDHKKSPVFALPEKRARRDLEHVLAFPDDEIRVKPVAVSEPLPGFGGRSDVRDHENSLLFHTKAGDLGEAGGFHDAHPS